VPLIIICPQQHTERLRALADETVIAEQGVSQPLIEAISKLAADPENQNPTTPVLAVLLPTEAGDGVNSECGENGQFTGEIETPRFAAPQGRARIATC